LAGFFAGAAAFFTAGAGFAGAVSALATTAFAGAFAVEVFVGAVTGLAGATGFAETVLAAVGLAGAFAEAAFLDDWAEDATGAVLVDFADTALGAVGFDAGFAAGAALPALVALAAVVLGGAALTAGFPAAAFAFTGAFAAAAGALLAAFVAPVVFAAFTTCSSLDDSWAGQAPLGWGLVRCDRRRLALKTLLSTMYCDNSSPCKSCPNGTRAGFCDAMPIARWARPFLPEWVVGGFCTSTKDTGFHIPVISK
jgi:hypothetical protein